MAYIRGEFAYNRNMGRTRLHKLLTHLTGGSTMPIEPEPREADRCPFVTERKMYTVAHVDDWTLITEYPIVQEWRKRVSIMFTDLSNLFRGQGYNFIDILVLNTPSDVEKWYSACTMQDSVEFRDELADCTPMLYIRTRVSHIVTCLKAVQGPPQKYITFMYTDPWEALLRP